METAAKRSSSYVRTPGRRDPLTPGKVARAFGRIAVAGLASAIGVGTGIVLGVMDTLGSHRTRDALGTSDLNELMRRVRMAGGRQLAETCAAPLHEFEQQNAVPVDERDHRPTASKQQGTGCGRQRRAAVPYTTPTFSRVDGALVPSAAEYRHEVVFCADDDHAAYWPRFAGRRGED